MLRNWVFERQNRTPETAKHFGWLLKEFEKDPGKVREVRGTVFISFPDEEFPGNESPLMDPGVQEFLHSLFNQAPRLLYYLSDDEAAASLLLCAAAFCPGALAYGENDRVGVALSEDFLTTIAQLLLNAAALSVQMGQSPDLVLTHVNGMPSSLREAFRDAVHESLPRDTGHT